MLLLAAAAAAAADDDLLAAAFYGLLVLNNRMQLTIHRQSEGEVAVHTAVVKWLCTRLW